MAAEWSSGKNAGLLLGSNPRWEAQDFQMEWKCKVQIAENWVTAKKNYAFVFYYFQVQNKL